MTRTLKSRVKKTAHLANLAQLTKDRLSIIQYRFPNLSDYPYVDFHGSQELDTILFIQRAAFMKTKPHVLFFTGQFPFPNDLSRCIFASHLSRALESQARLTVVCPVPYAPKLLGRLSQRYAELSGVPDSATIHGQKVLYPKYLSVPKLPRTAIPKLLFAGVIGEIEKIHKSDPFDLIHCRWLFPEGVAAVSLGRRLKIPSVLTAMGCDVNEYIAHSSMGPIIRGALAQANALTGVSNQLTTLLKQYSGNQEKSFYTPNGVNLESFSNSNQSKVQARQALGLEANSKSIIYVGRLAPEKNVELLLESFAVMQGDISFETTQLWIAGAGPLLNKLTQLATKLRLKNVTFLGSVKHSELANYIIAADLMALSSHQEGMPNAVIESLALGTPVVATAVGAVPDLINNDNGVITPPGDKISFAQALKLALTKDWDHLKIANGMRRTWNDAASDYMKAYDFALSRKAGA
jgi:teichuronic acid biosynthesis glycosyltransferase TuaC